MRTNKMKRTSLSRQAGTRSKLRKQRNLLIVALLASLMILAWLLIGGTQQSAIDFEPQSKSIEKSIQAGEQAHDSRMEALQKNEIYLQAQVLDFKQQAKQAKSTVQYLRKQTQQFSNYILVNPVTLSDTLQKLNDCDTLKEQVSELIEAEQYKDSIVNMQVMVYEDLITAKDSTINAWSEDYELLRMQTDTLMQINDKMNKQYKKTVRKARRIKTWHRVTSALALMLASGVTIRELTR